MSNERPDEFGGWAGRLEEPGALAGQGLADKEVSWEKLHSRLGNPSRGKRLSWYRVAAACLLMALVPATIIFRDRKPGGGQDIVTRRSGTAASPGVADDSLRGTGVQSPRKRLTPATPARRQELAGNLFMNPIPNVPAFRPLIKGRLRRHPASLSADTPVCHPVAVTAPPPPALAANGVVAPVQPATVKKELAVISINEIPDRVIPGPSVTDHQQHSKHFRIGLGNPGAIHPALAAQETGKTRFTIKLSSQNP